MKDIAQQAAQLELLQFVSMEKLIHSLRQVTFRGLYDRHGESIRPYQHAKISVAQVVPPTTIASQPSVQINESSLPLYTSQPTIYENQIQIMEVLDNFLKNHKYDLLQLGGGIQYYWPDRSTFHILPPIIERHTYELEKGFICLDRLTDLFKDCYVKDANNNLHDLSKRFLTDFHIDEVSKLDRMDIFNSNAPLINYGLPFTGDWVFNIICDGSHRIDYAIEVKKAPILALVIEQGEGPFIPYYAFPVPFRPTIRLSSKRAEAMHKKLERDKIHLFNDYINKVLHYDWTTAELNVSSLRSTKDIF